MELSHYLVQARQMTSSKHSSEDELLRDAPRSLDDEDEELRAIQDGIDSVERGDGGVSVEEAFQQLRAKHQ